MAAALALHGFAGAATVHPLERVESNEVRTRGRLSPIPKKRKLNESALLSLKGDAGTKSGMTCLATSERLFCLQRSS